MNNINNINIKACSGLRPIQCAALIWCELIKTSNFSASAIKNIIDGYFLSLAINIPESALNSGLETLCNTILKQVYLEEPITSLINALNSQNPNPLGFSDKDFWDYIQKTCLSLSDQNPYQNSGGSLGGKGSQFDFDLVIDNMNAAPIFSSSSANADFISDFCTYVEAQTQPLTGLFYLKVDSDVFTGACSDAAFLRVANKHCNERGIYVNVSCDADHHLHVDDVFKEFYFQFYWNSDLQKLSMDYTDGFCFLHKDFELTADPVTLRAKNRLMQNIFSDCSDFPQAHIDALVDCALICVDVESPVTQIDCIDCIPIASNIVSDAEYLCNLVHCACDIEHCLEDLYGNISDKIDHKCCVTYTGPVGAIRVRVDLENCRVFYEDFFIPGCSDISIY